MRALFADKTKSVLTEIDAGTKLLVTVATAVAALAASGLVGQLVLFAATLVYVLLLRRPVLLGVLYAAMAVMMGFAFLCALGLAQLVPSMGGLSVKSLVIPFLRGLSMMNVVMALALSSRVEDLMATLERMHLPFCLFLPSVVMIRFIPTFTNDIRQIWETLKIRGWPMGPWMLTASPFLSARLLFVPVLFRALKSSETLGIAAELKGLGSARRTVMPRTKAFSRVDMSVWVLTGLTIAAIVLAEIFLQSVGMTSSPRMR